MKRKLNYSNIYGVVLLFVILTCVSACDLGEQDTQEAARAQRIEKKIGTLKNLFEKNETQIEYFVEATKQKYKTAEDSTGVADIAMVESIMEDPDSHFEQVAASEQGEQKLDLMITIIEADDAVASVNQVKPYLGGEQQDVLENALSDSTAEDALKTLREGEKSLNLIGVVASNEISNQKTVTGWTMFRETERLNNAGTTLLASSVLYSALFPMTLGPIMRIVRAAALVAVGVSAGLSFYYIDKIADSAQRGGASGLTDVPDWLDENASYADKANFNRGFFKMGPGFWGLVTLALPKAPAAIVAAVYGGVVLLYKATVGYMLCITENASCTFTGLTANPTNPTDPTNPSEPGWIDVTPPDLPPNPCTNNPACGTY